MTSELRTKKGAESLPRVLAASLRGPAVPRGSVSTENSMRMLYSFSYYRYVMSAWMSRGTLLG